MTCISKITGSDIKYFRAPGFSLIRKNLHFCDILQSRGIEIDCSIFPIMRAHGGINERSWAKPFWIDCAGGKLMEMPLSIYRFMGRDLVLTGGGPANSTKILPTYLFDVSFQFFKLGRGAAIALTLLIVTIILGMILVKVFESPAGKVNQEGN